MKLVVVVSSRVSSFVPSQVRLCCVKSGSSLSLCQVRLVFLCQVRSVFVVLSQVRLRGVKSDSSLLCQVMFVFVVSSHISLGYIKSG